MPDKVNPVIPEMMMQVAFRVIGNDAMITRAAEGELDLNVWESIILEAITESIRLLRRGIPLFAEKCIAGVQANIDHGREDASNSLALSTALAAIYGYPVVRKLAPRAAQAQARNDSAGGISHRRAYASLIPLHPRAGR